jgi:TRAP transporter 4TM/12TM fusion protein
VILFAVSWVIMGAALPLICLAFVAHALWGHLLPSPFNHRPFDFEQIVEQLSFGTEGIYATPTGISATYIYLFILFGAFLERAGMIQLFNDIALGPVGSAKGGAAKVAVISSSLMGTISGSGVANVVTVGQFTIPLMRRFGYSGAFAGGVEATASMGGQIMPPVMGAVAFIMAENIGVPKTEIVKAAINPAIINIGSAFWMVHLEAGKRGLVGIPKEELPRPLESIRRQWYLLLPLCVLVFLLMDGFTPLFSGSVGLGLTAVMILGAADQRVPPSQGRQWVAALQQLGKCPEVRAVSFPGEGHAIASSGANAHAQQTAVAWLIQQLRRRPSATSSSSSGLSNSNSSLSSASFPSSASLLYSYCNIRLKVPVLVYVSVSPSLINQKS